MSFRLPGGLAGVLYPTVVLVVFVAGWEAAGRAGYVAPYILPVPSAILAKTVEMYDVLLLHTWVTTVEIGLGFLLAVGAGVILAVATIFSRPFEKAFYPWIVATQAVPKVALGPLFIIWFGFDLTPKIIIAGLIAFFPIMIGTMHGMRSVETEAIHLLRSMGASPLKMFWFLRLPHGLPSIFAGMKVAVVLAAVGAIVGEFVGANEGLGYVLLTANSTVDTQLLFAALLIISLLATAFYWIVHLAEWLLVGWHVSVRQVTINATA